MALLRSILLVAVAGYSSAIETTPSNSDACDAAEPECMMAAGQAMLQVQHGETTGFEEEEEMPEEVAEQIFLAEQEEKVLAFLELEGHAESQHDSQYDDSSEPPQICSDPSAFNATAPFGSGKCSFSKQLEKSECPSSGCYWNTHTNACVCYNKEKCQELGGEWLQPTCTTVAMAWERAALDAANSAGSCEGIMTKGTNPYQGETGGSANGMHRGPPQPLSKAIDMAARVCCTNFPATFCDPDAKLMKPCVNDLDFDGSKVLSGWCRMPKETPKPDECREAGCRAWERGTRYGCYCQGEKGCLEVGGIYNKHTCADTSKHWYSQSKAMQEAKDAGTCENVKLRWGSDLGGFVKREAGRCCKSFPKSLCNPEGKVPTFFLAAGGESCTEACQQRGKQCDLKALKEAASSVRECRRIIESLGKQTRRGGQYGDDNSGCTYHPGQTGWYQLMKRNGGDPACDTRNPDSSRQRICSCE